MTRKTATPVDASPVEGVLEKAKKPAKPPKEEVAGYEIGKQYEVDTNVPIVAPLENSRQGEHDPAEIAEIAKSIGKFGQLQACVAAVDDDGSLHHIIGYKRHAAICLWNKENPEKQKKVRYTIVKAASPLARLLLSIESDARTSALTLVDQWNAHNRLREAGWTNAKIAGHYGVDPSFVSHLQKLDDVEQEVLDRVKSGEIGLTMVKALAKIPGKDQPGVLDIAVEVAKEQHGFDARKGDKFDGTIDNGHVAEALRMLAAKHEPGEEAPSGTTEGASAEKGGEGETPTTPATPAKPAPAVITPLNLREVKEFFKQHCKGVGESEAGLRRLGLIMDDLFSGKRQKPLVDRLRDLLDGKPEPEPKPAKAKPEPKAKPAKVEAA